MLHANCIIHQNITLPLFPVKECVCAWQKKKKKKELNVYKVENGIQSDGSQRDLLTY